MNSLLVSPTVTRHDARYGSVVSVYCQPGFYQRLVSPKVRFLALEVTRHIEHVMDNLLMEIIEYIIYKRLNSNFFIIQRNYFQEIQGLSLDLLNR